MSEPVAKAYVTIEVDQTKLNQNLAKTHAKLGQFATRSAQQFSRNFSKINTSISRVANQMANILRRAITGAIAGIALAGKSYFSKLTRDPNTGKLLPKNLPGRYAEAEIAKEEFGVRMAKISGQLARLFNELLKLPIFGRTAFLWLDWLNNKLRMIGRTDLKKFVSALERAIFLFTSLKVISAIAQFTNGINKLINALSTSLPSMPGGKGSPVMPVPGGSSKVKPFRLPSGRELSPNTMQKLIDKGIISPNGLKRLDAASTATSALSLASLGKGLWNVTKVLGKLTFYGILLTAVFEGLYRATGAVANWIAGSSTPEMEAQIKAGENAKEKRQLKIVADKDAMAKLLEDRAKASEERDKIISDIAKKRRDISEIRSESMGYSGQYMGVTDAVKVAQQIQAQWMTKIAEDNKAIRDINEDILEEEKDLNKTLTFIKELFAAEAVYAQ